MRQAGGFYRVKSTGSYPRPLGERVARVCAPGKGWPPSGGEKGLY